MRAPGCARKSTAAMNLVSQDGAFFSETIGRFRRIAHEKSSED
jgi:hypothetical protein